MVAAGSGEPALLWIHHTARRAGSSLVELRVCWAGAGGAWSVGVDGEGCFDVWRGGGGSVDREGSAADFFECEREEGGPVRYGEFAELFVVAGVLVEQFVGDGVEGVVHGEGSFTGELEASECELVRWRHRQAVACEVGCGVVGAVGVEQCGEGGDVVAPLVEHGALGGVDQVAEDRGDGVVVAVVDDVGEHRGVVDADAPVGQCVVDRGQIGQPVRDRESPAGDTCGQRGTGGEPLRGGEP